MSDESGTRTGNRRKRQPRRTAAARGDRDVSHAILAAAFFAALTAFLQFNLIPYGVHRLALSPALSACLGFLSAIGIGAGKLVSDKLSARGIEFGVVPVGALLLSAALVALNFLPAALLPSMPVILLAGTGAGLFMAPLDSYLQLRAGAGAPAWRAGWAGALAGAALVLLNYASGFTAGQGFAAMGVLTLAVAAAALKRLPDFFLRFLILVFARLIYRMRVSGAENVPREGPALLVSNHISYTDPLLLIATQQRRLRFIMTREVYEGWRLATPLFKLLGCIPIEMTDPPKKIVAALQAARKAMDDGFIAGIFAEGALTRIGMLREFRKGLTKIMKNSGHPIIPVYIGGAWGTIASYYHGNFVGKWRGLGRHDVSVIFGKPMSASSTAAEVRLAVMELSCEYFSEKKERGRDLGREFIKAARWNWDRPAVSDSSGVTLTGGALLIGALELAAYLGKRTEGRGNIGLFLPPSAGGALANAAVVLAGQVPVNLDRTASAAAFASAVSGCGLRTIITSRVFLEKYDRPLPEGSALYLEDFAADPPSPLSALKARLAPVTLLLKGARPAPDDTAAIIFTSGTTGAPKGVMLSHHNILSNIEALRIVLGLNRNDGLCSALPFSHSLGNTAALWYPLLSGVPVAYHFNPLEAGAVARLAREKKSTLLFATPALLRLYARKAEKEDFASLRHVVAGAEKLDPELSAEFEQKFGLRPLEGYGSAELSPVAALSVPHADKDRFQTGWKEGSAGLPLPGVAMKVSDPATGADLPAGLEGRLLVKGPNVMKGYLNDPGLTAAAIKDGWYLTEDLAVIDEEGFVSLRGRLPRVTSGKRGV